MLKNINNKRIRKGDINWIEKNIIITFDDKDPRLLIEANKRAIKIDRIRPIHNEIFWRKYEIGKKLQSISHPLPQINILRNANIRIFTNDSISLLSRPNANLLFSQRLLVFSLCLAPPLSIIHTSYSLIPMVDIEIQMALNRERDSSSKNKRRLVIPQGPNENFWTYNDDGLARIKFLLKFVKYFIIVFSKSFLYQYVIFGKLSFQREGEGGSGWLSMRFEVN